MGIEHVDVVEAARRQRDEGATYLDVRSIPEFEGGHAAGAANVPLLHHDARTGRMVPNPDFVAVVAAAFPRDTRLLVGCQAGVRSLRAAEILAEAGFTHVVNVSGGFGGARHPATGRVISPGWMQAGLPVSTTASPGCTYEELSAKRESPDAR